MSTQIVEKRKTSSHEDVLPLCLPTHQGSHQHPALAAPLTAQRKIAFISHQNGRDRTGASHNFERESLNQRRCLEAVQELFSPQEFYVSLGLRKLT
jgi:hypothetical protein